MSLLPIIKWPNPLLQEISKPVSNIDGTTQRLMDDMLYTMNHENGIGLAAVQIGELKRILIIQIQENERYNDIAQDAEISPDPLFIINPEIIKESKELITYKEGCLSFPDQFANVKRHSEIIVKYLDYHGKEQVINATGILSICLQHEIDHLNGIRFIDHLSILKRNMILKKLKKNN
ncbi:MAG: peptide deformylase [Rickettsiales bacterium]|jgi:peptide deformylase|nr:peptide deformylase [Rickettsiales bacterium]